MSNEEIFEGYQSECLRMLELGESFVNRQSFTLGAMWAAKQMIDKSDQWMHTHLPRVLDMYFPNTQDEAYVCDMLNEDMRADYREAMS